MKSLSVIIPAFNEERFLGPTLEKVREAAESLENCELEIVVVDNGSADRTAEIASEFGAIVVSEPVRNIGRARNAGGRQATGEVFLFLDADTLIPPETLLEIGSAMSDSNCIGGAVDVHHRPKGFILRAYIWFWRIFGKLLGMAQGAAQFCRREAFSELDGYDEMIFMGEDVDFFWRMKKLACRTKRKTRFISEVRVVPSTRRWDQWPLWKTLFLTNPLTIALFRRRKKTWRDWREDPPR